MANISGGDKLEAYLASLGQKISNAASVSVGFFEDQTYTDGTSLPLVAALNEFGRPDHNQPPRPFMRNTVAKHSAEWGPAVGAVLASTGFDAHKALEQVGQAIQGQIQDEIQTLTDPPLAPSTIARKGFSKPLQDTGYMASQVQLNVKD